MFPKLKRHVSWLCKCFIPFFFYLNELTEKTKCNFRFNKPLRINADVLLTHGLPHTERYTNNFVAGQNMLI